MEDLHFLLTATLDLFKTPFTIYGFQLSFWQIMLWGVVAALLIGFIVEVFNA